jgi:hypothetical protein
MARRQRLSVIPEQTPGRHAPAYTVNSTVWLDSAFPAGMRIVTIAAVDGRGVVEVPVRPLLRLSAPFHNCPTKSLECRFRVQPAEARLS